MIKDITVVIPGAGRPQFLGDLLSSIREQTALERVAEVVVSEDGGTRHLESVAASFPELPIRYVSRNPALGFLGHHQVLLCQEARTPLTALLHDDDWWAPGHLATACAALDHRPECSAYFANIYDAYGLKCPMEIKFHNWGWRAWVASGCDFSRGPLKLDLAGVLTASLLEATFHFSTLVGRSEAVGAAFAEVVQTENGFDCDRTFPVFLAERGDVLFGTEPSAFIRIHAAQETQRYVSMLDCMVWKAETTRWMVARWPGKALESADRFNNAVTAIDPALWKKLSEMTFEPLKSLLIDEYGFRLWRETPARNAKYWVKQFTPPVILDLRRWTASKRRSCA